MPEFNRNFAKGKMSKDLDERLVPEGEYRDALNVEVSTSEGSDVGALQTLWGNKEVTPGVVPPGSYCVGTFVNNEENCIYWLVAGAEEEVTGGHFVKKDYIIKYSVDTGQYTYVFVDLYQVKSTVEEVVVGGNNYIRLTSAEGIRNDMQAIYGSGALVVDRFGYPDTDIVHIQTGFDLNNVTAGDQVLFNSRRVLNFSKFHDITGINIVDELIMFTDDISEPKIVNIKRSIMGTGGVAQNGWFSIGEGQDALTHTRLISERRDGLFVDDGFEVVNNPDYPDVLPAFSELENNTTIKKNPLTPPTLLMSAAVDGENSGGFTGTTTFSGFLVGSQSTVLNTGTQVQITFDQVGVDGAATQPMDLDVNDFVVLTNDLNENPTDFRDFEVRLQVVAVIDAWTFMFSITSINPEISSDSFFYARKQQVDPLFEFKFPRFAYRYKYVDGQYSAFSPFSEVAFLPGPFSMDPKEGYNLGMANRLRNLRVQNYAPHPDNRPKDVVEIDILYKEDKSTAVYTVKTLRRQDGIDSLLWPEDEGGLTDYIDDVNIGVRGSINITSELIHAIVPENQMLRPWDNVPRLAKAQEVSGNRLIYANYLQNYNFLDVNNRLITPTAELVNLSIPYDISGTNVENPLASVKTMRTYQLGVVYRDEMGRETPVMADKLGGSIYLGKEFCDQQTSLVTKISNNAPNWATSFKFFIKETSNEYYNLGLDRWYNAEDGNVWLSFQSSDRNKIDIETFLELKKAHDSTTPVTEPARYKVLAIENEAPQYIKLDRQSQGTLQNDSFDNNTNNLIGVNGVDGFPIDGYDYIIVEIGAFDEEFGGDVGDNPVWSKSSECSLKIRDLGGNRSEWYDITRLETGSFFGNAGDDGVKIHLAKALGSDVNFCSTANTWGTRNAGLIVEITHNEYVDKPEFDGKFFVKVFRDRVLEDNVMILDDENLTVVQSYPIGYLHTYKLRTGGTANCANTKNDAGGLMLNVLDKYYEGIAGNGDPNTESGGPGNSTNHPHPFGYQNSQSGGGTYRWGDNASDMASGGSNIEQAHPWLAPKSSGMPWNYVTDPSEENGAIDPDYQAFLDGQNDGSNLQDNMSPPDGDGNFFSAVGDVIGGLVDFISDTFGSIQDLYGNVVAGDNGHRGIGKHQWGADENGLWRELTTRDDGNRGRPYVFIDDAWALTWGISEELVHNVYKDELKGDQGGGDEAKRCKAAVLMHSAPWMGDYGRGWTDSKWENDPFTLPNGNSVTFADLLLAPWDGTVQSGDQGHKVDVGRQYFAEDGQSSTGAADGGTDFTFRYQNDFQQPLRSGHDSSAWNFGSGWDAPTWAQNGSAGVRDNLIDISVVGGMPGMGGSSSLMGEDGDTNQGAAIVNDLRFLQGDANIVGQELDFFEKLFIEGVRWRFRQDPDKTLYTTQDHYEHYGIINCQRSDAAATNPFGDRGQYYHAHNKRNKFTVQVDKDFGSGPSGWIPTHNLAHDGSEAIHIEIMGPYATEDSGPPSDNPAIFETHPKEDIGLDIYYEISRAYPIRVSKEDDETLSFLNSTIEGHLGVDGILNTLSNVTITQYEFNSDPTVGSAVKIVTNTDMSTLGLVVNAGDVFRIRDSWGGAVDVGITQAPVAGENFIWIDPNIHNKRIELPWHNCYVFGNGVESDRIRDDFNQPTIQNGVKASTTLAEQYKEERRREGLIFSGIFNSKTGVNRLNQFIQAEPITKDLNPDNGSIQKLFARDTDIITFCEDKVLKIMSKKDALFNADGNSNVTATAKVLGAAIPFAGDYGISKNPESFANDRYRCYFTDVQNGAVLRLSGDGITNISDYGMKDWFTDKFYALDRPRIQGSFDARKENYNITITNRAGAATVVPNQNVNPGEIVFTGIESGHQDIVEDPIFHNTVASPPPPPPPPTDPQPDDSEDTGELGPNTQWSTGCDQFWMPPEGPDALPNVPGFSECGWPINGQFVIGNTTYSVAGWAMTQSPAGTPYSQTWFAWPSVLNPNPPSIVPQQMLNQDHFWAHGLWAGNIQNN